MRTSVLKGLLGGWGVISLALFLLLKQERLPGWMNTALEGKKGDLYYLTKLSAFSQARNDQDFLQQESKTSSNPENADVLIMGDSFMQVFAKAIDRFSTKHDQQIYVVSTRHNPALLEPLFKINTFEKLLQKTQVRRRRGAPRTLIVESVERELIRRFATPQPITQPSGLEKRFADLAFRAQAKFNQWFVLKPVKVDYFLKHSVVTSAAYGAWADARFALFQEVPGNHLYTRNPPWLFFGPTQSNFTDIRPDSLIQEITANLVLLQAKLLGQYNLKLVFMPVPDKLSVYGHLVTEKPYDNFVPRLCKALEQAHVPVICLYDDFKASAEPVYHPTDTHWNPDGMRIAVQKIEHFLPASNSVSMQEGTDR
ncbi:SGNH hydrolase-like domain-containing protein, acetyltransferase AlgX [Catalinimonas alkaloidigena]|uniref:SGNH hydrolase-like domain-containing protein, acetyltransferase AlgX n=1 Tax=Catalinimonas alkaloidigena TaxID=1075417 RepID=A0A1G9LFZ9_9BACT|nr:hypothetical protein [Catalinimonas alkaloidigena]SDL60872.1 SGNH hydrolase-like domain-containing protein, acetyltransferase AlgX [Catalinimonas alkaloidigena]